MARAARSRRGVRAAGTTGWTAIRRHQGDSDLRTASLAAWARDGIDGIDLPEAGSAPGLLARFFAGLTASQRARLVDRYPFVVGNLNGVPLTLRYRANRLALVQAREVELGRMRDKRLTLTGRQTADRRMHRFQSLMGEGRQILAFDPDGSGRVAEVFGDLGRAERVSVVVPGVDTNVVNFERTRRKYTAPVGMAKSLYAAERERRPVPVPPSSPGPTTPRPSVSAWTRPSASSPGRAPGGSTPSCGPCPATRRCRSSATATARWCAAWPPPPCRPGSPTSRSRAAPACGSRARSSSAPGPACGPPGTATDWIQEVPYLEVGGLGHGADPVTPEFGARVFSASGAIGHTGYFEPGTESLSNFAGIGVGSYSTISCADDDGACRSGISGAEAN